MVFVNSILIEIEELNHESSTAIETKTIIKCH